jgi:histidine triad (HIT) family protein
MYSHTPKNYICPFCLLTNGIENEHVSSRQSDIVYQNDYITAFICSQQWPNNKGHVLIIPNEHFENLYDLPLYLATRIHELTKEIGLAMKSVYGCDGISTRQHNEPHGNQEVWHYHLHVYPRYKNDQLYTKANGELMAANERAEYAQKLRFFLSDWQSIYHKLSSHSKVDSYCQSQFDRNLAS